MTVNIEKPDFDEPREQEGFRGQRARLSRQAGAERLGLSLQDERDYYDGESAPG